MSWWPFKSSTPPSKATGEPRTAAPTRSPRPATTRPDPSEVFLEKLDALGIPHSSTVKALVERYGLTPSLHDPSRRRIRLVDVPLFLPGQLGPIEVSQHQPNLLPPELLVVYARADGSPVPSADAGPFRSGSIAGENAGSRAIIQALTERFGAPTKITPDTESLHRDPHVYVLQREWQFGDSALSTETREPRRHGPDAEPGLAPGVPFCSVMLRPHHIPALSDQEREWLSTVTPYPHIPYGLGRHGDALGSLRRVPPELRRPDLIVGRTARREALVGMENDRAFVVPRGKLRGLDLSRSSGTGDPRDGGPGSSVTVAYSDGSTTQCVGRTRLLFMSELEHGLDRVADTIARDFGLQVRISG